MDCTKNESDITVREISLLTPGGHGKGGGAGSIWRSKLAAWALRERLTLKQVAVHVLDHALEFANPAASVLLPSTVPLLLEACSDSSPSVSLVR